MFQKFIHYLTCSIIVLTVTPFISYCESLEVVTENWRPYNYEEQGVIKGISSEIVKKVLDRSGLQYTISIYPWSRAYKMALEKENVLIYTIIRIPQRENLFKWVSPLGKGGVTSLYRLKDNTEVHIKTLEDAKKLDIVTNLNSMDHIWLTNNGFTQLYTPAAVENAIKMIFKKRINLIAFDNTVMKKECANFGFDSRELVEVIPLFKTPPYMALSLKTSDSILQQLQRSYNELFKEKKINGVN
ncbi:MAG: transporter substrate-binding domain-containing protein [Candidatus Magnetomorum sp.]|nr:transporter substrate-binding domain-containing protein [Candidatus Magnetomorum sp.]